MDISSPAENNFFDSYEVKLFNKIGSELLLLEKILETNKTSINEGKNNLSHDKIGLIWSSLNQLISNEKKEVEKNFSQNEIKTFTEVLFIIVSMIDEFFLRKEKPISDFWNKNLFEFLFFNSRSAGNVFFERIDEVIQNKSEKKKSVLFVYLLALSMGFKGKYFGVNKEKEILYYKRSLYSIIYNKSSHSLEAMSSFQLSNSLESDNHDAQEKSVLVNNRKIYRLSIILVCLYLVISYVLFYNKKLNLEKTFNHLNTSLEFIEK